MSAKIIQYQFTLPWFDAINDRPDDEITVLIADTDGDVSMGFHDGDDGWRYATGESVVAPILFWADLPTPPNIDCHASTIQIKEAA